MATTVSPKYSIWNKKIQSIPINLHSKPFYSEFHSYNHQYSNVRYGLFWCSTLDFVTLTSWKGYIQGFSYFTISCLYWLIDCSLTSSEQYFCYIHDKNSLQTINRKDVPLAHGNGRMFVLLQDEDDGEKWKFV